jgi:urate oxidase
VNHKDEAHFTRAFHEKFDGLRILQYMKTAKEPDSSTDEENLQEFLSRFYSTEEIDMTGIDLKSFSFTRSPVEELEKIRMFLFNKEMEVRFSSEPL